MSGANHATHQEPMMDGEAASVTPRSTPEYRDDPVSYMSLTKADVRMANMADRHGPVIIAISL
jgi:hypothetical protein